MYMSDTNSVESEVSQSVIDLVDHIWAETTGHLDDVLAIPVHSITPEQVEHYISYR